MESWDTATQPESRDHSDWYLGHYYPRVKKYGTLGVTTPVSKATTKSSRELNRVDPIAFRHSYYRKWFASRPELKNMSPEDPKAINAYRKAHNLVDSPENQTPQK
jgi:hypothetical protein